MSCNLVIPGTYIACGEGGCYCSEACEQSADAGAENERIAERAEWAAEDLARNPAWK